MADFIELIDFKGGEKANCVGCGNEFKQDQFVKTVNYGLSKLVICNDCSKKEYLLIRFQLN